MFSRWKILFLLVLFLVPTMVQGQHSFKEDALQMDLATGSYGADLQVGDLSLPKTFLAQIDSVNSGRYDMIVEISSDDVRWKILVALAQKEKVLGLEELKIQWKTLHRCADAALILVRDNEFRIKLEELGLVSPRIFVRYKLPDESQADDTAYAMAYAERAPWVEPVRANATRIDHLEHDYAVIHGELQGLKDSLINDVGSQASNWSLCLGGEGAAVKNGKPIIVPALDLEVDRGNFTISATAGYRPDGEQDQKFFAGTLSYLPGESRFGLVFRAIYASHSLKSNGGYIQQGYGPTFGLVFREDWATIFATIGIQYMDIQGEAKDREIENTFNLGAKLRILSF